MIKYEKKAARELSKIDRKSAKNIKRFFDERIATNKDPRRFGKSLTGNWRYRIGDYRVIT